MRKQLLLPICFALLLPSCASYRVEGTTNVRTLNGQHLYLKVPYQGGILDLDSCEVIHGAFQMGGELDSVVLGELYLGSESLMPIVVEKGKINISIENSGLEASGTPLNERLYGFIREKNLLEERLSDIHHKQMQQIMDGVSADEAERQAEMESEALVEEMNQLIANFVTSNFDNPLAVQIFSIYCMSFPQPTINKTIQEILDKAPTSFKEDAFVKEYLQHIEENK
ncbi:MAG: DUF4369 domain-containing protein [Bacteroidaceae bacterium]|nr:DUF4369 domain-containing protein [Bacteroidaceae bacterium]